MTTERERSRLFDALFRPPSGGIPALDGLRAISVLLVVFFHATGRVEIAAVRWATFAVTGSLRWFLNQLWLGVDVFFVLSGFLIGRILLRQLVDGPIDFRGFYIRRVARIFPAYYVVLFSAAGLLSQLPVFAAFYGMLSGRELAIGALKDALLLNNYLRERPEVMGWAWSLCVEEHFYLVTPLVLTMLFRAAPAWRLGVLVLLPFVPTVIRAAIYKSDPTVTLWPALQFMSHTHCEGLLVGVLIAYLQVVHGERLIRVVRRWQWVLELVTLACFAAFFAWGGVFRSGAFAAVFQLLVLAIGIGTLVTVCVTVVNPMTRCLAHPVWYPIARVSYGIYLVHPLVALWLLDRHVSTPFGVLMSPVALLGFGAATAACSFLVACVLFFTVELPMLRWGARVASSPPSRADADRVVDPATIAG